MTEADLDDWLGPEAASTLSRKQRERLHRIGERIYARYNDDDDAEYAFSAATMLTLGMFPLIGWAELWRRARGTTDEHVRMTDLHGAVIASAETMSARRIARQARIDRGMVDQILGYA